jgi:hypothetical protein
MGGTCGIRAEVAMGIPNGSEMNLPIFIAEESFRREDTQ